MRSKSIHRSVYTFPLVWPALASLLLLLGTMSGPALAGDPDPIASLPAAGAQASIGDPRLFPSLPAGGAGEALAGGQPAPDLPPAMGIPTGPGGSPSSRSSGVVDLEARNVSTAVAVRDAAVEVRDVTDRYVRRGPATLPSSGSPNASPLGSLPAPSPRDEDLFARTVGDAGWQFATDVIRAADGSIVAVGEAYTEGSAQADALIVKFDGSGELLWARTTGGAASDGASAVCETADGGYALAGYTSSYGAGGTDAFLAKFDAAGILLWARAAGSSASDRANGVCERGDGSLAVAGFTNGFGAADNDLLLLEFTGGGTFQEARRISGFAQDYLYSLRPTADGGLVAAGLSGPHGGDSYQASLIRFAASGALSWERIIGGTGTDYGIDALETADGGYVLVGQSDSYDAGECDVFLARFDSAGTPEWTATVGEAGIDERGRAVVERPDGGYVVAGYATTTGTMALLLSLDSAGTLEWARAFDGPSSEDAMGLAQRPGGGYILAGQTSSFGAGQNDLLVAAVSANGLVPGCEFGATHFIEATPRTPTWWTATTVESVPAVSVQALAPDVTDPAYAVEEVCDYEPADPEYWLTASGGPVNDWGWAIGQTSEGGFLVAAICATEPGKADVLLLKYGVAGELLWARQVGGPEDDQPADLVVTADGGCLVAGGTSSYGAGGDDALLLGFGPGGDLRWARTIGGTGSDRAASLSETAGGDYLAAGFTTSYGAGATDMMLITLEADGAIPSVVAVGSSINEQAHCAIRLSSGEALLAGLRTSSLGDVDGLAVGLDPDGGLLWDLTCGGGGYDSYAGVVELPDGDVLLGGCTGSYGSYDGLLERMDLDGGSDSWFRATGTAGDDYFYDLQMTPGGEIVVCGEAIPERGEGSDAILCLLDDQAQPLWTRRIGGTGDEQFFSVIPTADGGFAAAGATDSFGLASVDVLAMRTDGDGRVYGCPHVSDETFVTTTPYPPHGSYAFNASEISPFIGSPTLDESIVALENLALCHAEPTVSASLSCLPTWGIVPFVSQMTVILESLYAGQTRQVAARIDVTLASGSSFSNWRSGYTNLVAGDSFMTSWPQTIPALGAVVGTNEFLLTARDVTPAPFNQPPYPPSGDEETDLQIVTAYAP